MKSSANLKDKFEMNQVADCEYLRYRNFCWVPVTVTYPHFAARCEVYLDDALCCPNNLSSVRSGVTISQFSIRELVCNLDTHDLVCFNT